MLNYLVHAFLSEQNLRRKHVFKIVPMVNPDGVIVGNYRTNLAARDLNRTYMKPRKVTDVLDSLQFSFLKMLTAECPSIQLDKLLGMYLFLGKHESSYPGSALATMQINSRIERFHKLICI